VFKLEGKVSYLVPFDEQHMNSEEYLNWLRDYDVVKTINRLDYLRPVSFAEVRNYCETLIESENDIFLAIYEKKDDLFIGTIRAGHIDWHTRVADIGILIGNKSYWGKGIATDSIHTLGNYLFDKLGLRKLTAGLMGVNPAMLKVFEKLGFQQEGVFRKQDLFEGEYVDHIYLGCFRNEFRRE
jgi:RimJ/RimL family protein N-acetyltransferase